MLKRKEIAEFYRTQCTKGFSINGFFIGLTIFYHSNGNLESVGEFNIDHNAPRVSLRGRKLGHWKYFNEKGNMCKEEIHIR